MGEIVVTGAASGIGRALAERLVADGRAVVGVDVRPTGIDGVRDAVCDLADAAAVDALVGDLLAGPPLAGLVNCAGLPGTHPPGRVLAVNLLAVRRLTDGLAGHVVDGGAVVHVASVAAHRSDRTDAEVAALLAMDDAAAQAWLAGAGLDGTATYDLTKKALLALTLVHARAHLGRLRCLSVSPGPTETPILGDFVATMGEDRMAASAAALGGHATADDVAGVLAFALSDDARWVSGIDLRVDRGLIGARLAPDVEAVR